MNRFIFLCHVREDQGLVTNTLGQSLASLGMKVLYRTVSPWLPSEQPRGLLREEIQTGLIECCYGVVLLSRAFINRNWPPSELDEVVSRVISGEERLIHLRLDIGPKDIAKCYSRLASRPAVSLAGDYDRAAEDICRRLAKDDLSRTEALRRTHLSPKSVALFACRECGNNDDMTLECLTAPPIGATGMLVCTVCGRGYPIRGGIPQLLGEGAVNPDEPPPANLQPSVDLSSAGQSLSL